MSGRVVHFELPADDLDRASGFYSTVFGWALTPIPGMDYATVQTTPSDHNGMPTDPGAINGGMASRKEPVTRPVITIDVDDVDDALRRIESSGGKTVVTRQPVGDMGFIGYFNDTEGNLIGLWQTA